ncbi:hypothetical protein CBR_g30819 [Chara braunii]|uniref:beta-galactoside alpha-(2,6)-sialyltransferase n=1 Tax=Chara braunii TaxID=69332 RepID=A0A388JXH5_CHABU|nr:hypothetical protein CBR_g30819 [Chara braunii]|eukprot:GBG62500.1 hypothetical protein CBR_g30819 [Chara braunii]
MGHANGGVKPNAGGGSTLNLAYRSLLFCWGVGLIYLAQSLLGDERLWSNHQDDTLSLGQSDMQSFKPPEIGRWSCNGVNQSCECQDGYAGPKCDQAICPQPCVHGWCLQPSFCECDNGWKGVSCKEPVCKKKCVHGVCSEPNVCKCDEGWFGWSCSRQCGHGQFLSSEVCICAEGWSGDDCNSAICIRHGCIHGNCIAPDNCVCLSGWSGPNCTRDEIRMNADKIMYNLELRVRRLPALMVHRNADDAVNNESWRRLRQWTSHLIDHQWRISRTHFMDEVPTQDVLLRFSQNRYPTCAAVGNSGILLLSRMGIIIDNHDIVLRFNRGPTKNFEDFVGTKTDFRLLNLRGSDALIEADGSTHKVHHHRPRHTITLLWRAEAFHYYTVIRHKFPDDAIYLLSPDFLIPTINTYKTAMERLAKMNITWETLQAAPNGFVGIAFLLQICHTVDVYGFDQLPERFHIKNDYHDKSHVPVGAAVHPSTVEFNILRAMHAFGLIRLCNVVNFQLCGAPPIAKMDQPLTRV